MRVAIVTTGDEILQGIIVDTNSAWLSEKCEVLGHEVVWHASVGDDHDAIGETLRLAVERADVVLVSGGLGPTTDDITIEAATKAFGEIRQTTLPNNVGTAPGIQMHVGRTEVFFFPGVPKELYQIFSDSVAPWLATHATQQSSAVVLRCFGLPEATIDEKLRGVDLVGCRLSFRVKFPEILLRLLLRGKDAATSASLTRAARAIRERLGSIVYGEGEATLPEVVGKMLKTKGHTLAVAESCTGGYLANIITDIPGSSDYFERGVVAYSNRSKLELLGVPANVIEQFGAVSREVALEMAKGIRERCGTSFGLAVTGIAGPTGGTPQKPVGTVFMALASEKVREVHAASFARERSEFKQIVAWTALDLLRRHLA